MKIGIIREGKTPPDARVPLTPAQCAHIQNMAIDIVVQPSPIRCYSDAEYRDAGIKLQEDLSDRDVLMGVKEVPIDQLIADKTYFFFSHTIKKQVYNRKLLQAILQKNIHLLDYEVLTNDQKQRLIAFGRFAGMVGAHNGIWVYGQKTGAFDLKRMVNCKDYAEARAIYKTLSLPPMKIVLTGAGRVGQGAAQVLEDMGIKQVSSYDFLENDFDQAVFTQLDCEDYVKRKDGSKYNRQDFFKNPTNYESAFSPYTKVSDIMINGIYWDNNAPAFFTKDDMKRADFNIQVIADVTCDIAPVSSIPSTIKASTIADPVFGYDPQLETETSAYGPHSIDMMTIDNLPNELPRDASEAFGEQFIEFVLGELTYAEHSKVIERASVTLGGKLGPHFGYLEDYVNP